MVRARISIKSGVLTKGDIAKAGSGVQLGHHYQADSGTAGETITHSVGWITGACPLTIPCASAHGVGAAASIVLRQGQETEGSAAPRTPLPQPSLGRGPGRSLSKPHRALFLLISQF